jgi:hypothetical protein
MKSNDILRLYRDILRHAHKYPSIKRIKILQEIKMGFREQKDEVDSSKNNVSICKAIKGLEQLQMYTNLSKNNNEWTIYLEENPIPSNY